MNNSAQSNAPPFQDLVPSELFVKPGAKRGRRIPWWAKIAAKVVMSRLLPSYDVRKSLGLFQHGNMDRNPTKHIDLVKRIADYGVKFGRSEPQTLLELGPGDSVGTALAAKAWGFRASWLVDVGDFATREMASYEALANALTGIGRPLPNSIDYSGRDALLKSSGATYVTDGVKSLAQIEGNTVDLLFSSAVLEHVARYEFDKLMAETFRILRPGAIAHHQIDLMDHLGGSLNNLRFSERFWEGQLMSRSGFYTNRLRCTEIMSFAQGAGFQVAVTQFTRWPQLPIPREALAAPFRELPEHELLVATFGLLLRKPADYNSRYHNGSVL